MHGAMPTEFASAERAPQELVLEQYHVFLGTHCRAFFDALPTIILALNAQRQIVYANHAALSFLEHASAEVVLGQRPGEVFGCVNVECGPSGCGTSKRCRSCGMVQAILNALEGALEENSCRLIRRGNGLLQGLDLHVQASPVEVAGNNFVIFALTNTNNESRRHSMERIFFHDVLNLAGGINGLVEVIKNQGGQRSMDNEMDILHRATQSLVDEILAQRELMAAENNELTPIIRAASTCEMLIMLKGVYEKSPSGQFQEIVIDPACHDTVINTDARLVQRVLGNMIKNALEAGMPGDVIHLGCDDEENAVRLWVRNSGAMTPDAQDNVFRRRFSTKGDSRGLGTYSMMLLAERYLNASVGFTSGEEQGTTFYLRLPKRTKTA